MRSASIRIFGLVFLAVIIAFNSFGQVEDFENVNFEKADSIAQLYPRHSLADIRGLSEKLTSSLPTEVEKFRAIYHWVCSNIDNDYYLYRENQLKRERLRDAEEIKRWNKKFSSTVMETLLKKQRTVCTGYAYLIRELALHAGLSCKMIDGYGRTAQSNIGGYGMPNHTWNAIQLNHKWYLCDATWSSGAIDTEKKTFEKKYNDKYFLLAPEFFIRNHYPVDSTWMLIDKKPTLLEFLTRPLVYSSALDFKIDQLFPETFIIDAEKGKPVSFHFQQQNKEVIEKIELQTKPSDNLQPIRQKIQRSTDGQVSFEHTFSSKGIYVLHVLLNGRYALSYSVHVR